MQLEKVTKLRQGNEKRRYEDACGLAHALDLIGERWAILVMRELMFGPRRFSDLKADLPGISANVLTQRLTELEQRGLVRKTRLPPPASVQVYEATEWGLEAAPVLRSLGKWAVRSLCHDPSLPVSHVSVMMSMQTMFDGERAGGLEARVGFRFGDTGYVADIAKGRIDIRRGEPEGADLLFTAEPAQIAGLLYGGAPLESVEPRGDMELARRFITLFPLPPKIG
ncbi:MAG: winged helix-turn-helix transcriptional regulator [Sphingomicrobium sp.]